MYVQRRFRPPILTTRAENVGKRNGFEFIGLDTGMGEVSGVAIASVSIKLTFGANTRRVWGYPTYPNERKRKQEEALIPYGAQLGPQSRRQEGLILNRWKIPAEGLSEDMNELREGMEDQWRHRPHRMFKKAIVGREPKPTPTFEEMDRETADKYRKMDEEECMEIFGKRKEAGNELDMQMKVIHVALRPKKYVYEKEECMDAVIMVENVISEIGVDVIDMETEYATMEPEIKLLIVLLPTEKQRKTQTLEDYELVVHVKNRRYQWGLDSLKMDEPRYMLFIPGLREKLRGRDSAAWMTVEKMKEVVYSTLKRGRGPLEFKTTACVTSEELKLLREQTEGEKKCLEKLDDVIKSSWDRDLSAGILPNEIVTELNSVPQVHYWG
jgi:hypothetical protein